MATRFRLPSSGSPAVSPAFESYTHANAVRRPLPTTDASVLGDVAQTPDGADHLVAGDTSHFQGTSDGLAAQTIAAQTVKLDLQGFMAHNNNLLKVQLFIKVVSNDGTTTLATLLAKTTGATTNLGTSLGNKVLSATTTAYTIGAGDAGARIVVEISVTGTPTAAGGTQGHNATMRWGSDGAGGDLPETSETGTTFNPWLEFPNTLTFQSAGSAAITGTATAAIDEADIVAGGKTVIVTLTGDTWVAAGATFDAQRQAIIDGLDSAQAEATGWNAEVRNKLAVTAVVRTSDTVVTITLSAQAAYNITAQETITVTVPGAALTGGSPLTATPTFTVDFNDVTAPVLSAQTVDSITSDGGTPKVTTDEGNGTAYMVVVPNGDVPSTAQIKAGQQSSGAAALAASNQAVSGTGVQTFAAVTGLTAETAYDVWFVHTDAALNNSTAVKADFTTLTAVVERTWVCQMMALTVVEREWTSFMVNEGPPPPEPGGLLDIAARRRRRPHWKDQREP